MRKALKFYLVASTIMSSIALAGKEEHLENLDRQGLKIVLKAVTHKCDLSFEEEFDIHDPMAKIRVNPVLYYIDTVLSEKSQDYWDRMRKAGRGSVEFARLENKQKQTYNQKNKLLESFSNWISLEFNNRESIAQSSVFIERSSSSGDQHSNWALGSVADELDEKALKVAIQAVTNHCVIDDKELDMQSLEDQKRKENVEKFLKTFLQKKSDSSGEKRLRKISIQIDGLRSELIDLKNKLLEIDEHMLNVKIQRQKEVDGFLQRRHYSLMKVAAEQQLQELNLLDDLFLAQVRKDHAASMWMGKGIIPPNATLDDAMGIYAESVMSITKVMKENGYVRDLIEKVFNLLQGEVAVTFQEASKSISDKAIEMGKIEPKVNYSQICLHLKADHSNFPQFEKFTRMYYQLFGDPTSLVCAQQNACKNGLYGRTVFYTFLALKEQLAQGVRNPSQLPAAFSREDVLNVVGLKEALLTLQKEEDADKMAFLEFCQKTEREKENIAKDILAKEAELTKFAREMDKLLVLDLGQVDEAPRRTFRTTGANPNAKNKQSATSIKLSNREMQDAAYQLIVTHRTRGSGPLVRIFNPSTRTYINLGTLPSSVDFSDTPFDLTSWAKAVRHDSALESGIVTYVSFLGESDIHSLKIKSRERTLKEVIFGDKESESQSGIHVYAPETDGDANAWSEAKEDDVQ